MKSSWKFRGPRVWKNMHQDRFSFSECFFFYYQVKKWSIKTNFEKEKKIKN